MKLTRRDFIRNAAFATAGVGLSSPLFAGTKKLIKPNIGSANEKVVIVINLFGGNDGINTVIPHSPTEFAAYHTLRGSTDAGGLGYTEADLTNTLIDGGNFALNPGMTAFKSLYDSGKLAVVTGVGVPPSATGLFDHDAGQFEFQSCDIVRAGITAPSGWLGRFLDTVTPGQVSPGVDLGGGRLMLTGNTRLPISIYTVNDFKLQISAGGSEKTARRTAYTNIMNMTNETAVGEVNRSFRQQALIQSDVIKAAVATYPTPPESYPDSWLGTQLRECAKIVYGNNQDNVGVRAMAVGTGGYDTHGGQISGYAPANGTYGYHADILKDVADSVSALYADLQTLGLSNNVLILTISEFGRRAYSNSDVGTDHGFGSTAFALGDMVTGGIYGSYPSLQDQFLVFDGSLDVSTDFRNFYATVLANYLGADPNVILGGTYGPLMSFV